MLIRRLNAYLIEEVRARGLTEHNLPNWIVSTNIPATTKATSAFLSGLRYHQ